jgi:hypothetical protein
VPNIASDCQRVESADGRESESRRMLPGQARKRQSVRRLPRLSAEPFIRIQSADSDQLVSLLAAVACRGHFGTRRDTHPSAQSLTITDPPRQRTDFRQQVLIRRTSPAPSGSRGKELKSLPSASKTTALEPSSAGRARMAAGVHQRSIMLLPSRPRPSVAMRSAFTRFFTRVEL